jgi:purine-binding chemotaxis protein CheW
MGGVVVRPVREVLVFEIGGRRYGLPASDVRELVRAVAILPLELDSDCIEGVIDLRGAVVPVLDLRGRLRLPSRSVEPSDHFIIIAAGADGRSAALRVDRALELIAVGPAAAEPAPEPVSGSEQAVQVVRGPDGLVPLLDLRPLLAMARAVAIPGPSGSV